MQQAKMLANQTGELTSYTEKGVLIVFDFLGFEFASGNFMDVIFGFIVAMAVLALCVGFGLVVARVVLSLLQLK